MVKHKVSLEELGKFKINKIEEIDSDFGLDAISEGLYERWIRYRVQEVDNEKGLFFSFDVVAESKSHSYKKSFDFSVDIAYEPYFECNFIVVDEDGDELNFGLVEIIDSAKEVEDWEHKIMGLLPEPEEAEILEEEGEGEMKKFILERDGGPDLMFFGDRVAQVVSNETAGRWLELNLFKSRGGKFICQKIKKTQWEGEYDFFDVKVCKTETEVKEYFGQGRLSKELYNEAKIENIEFVE